jgi:hypothetical protein
MTSTIELRRKQDRRPHAVQFGAARLQFRAQILWGNPACGAAEALPCHLSKRGSSVYP